MVASGNVLFDFDERPTDGLEELFAHMMAERFDIASYVAVRSAAEVAAALAGNPSMITLVPSALPLHSSIQSWPAQITDCKAAIRFLRAHARDYNLAPGRIAVWGSSAGGHLAALVGTSGSAKKFDIGEHLDHSSAVSCSVDMFGPIDFEKMPQFTSPTSPEAKMWGRATSEALDLAREACPITYLTKDTPPVLILHGDADTVIHISQSQLFHDAMKNARASGDFITLPGVGHSHAVVWTKELERILTFFKRHLSKDASDPLR